MSKIVISQREFHRSYINLYKAYNTSKKKNNKQVYLLMLFYAVENGLKYIWMKENNMADTSKCGPDFNRYNHNLNEILNSLKANPEMRLPFRINMKGSKKYPQRAVFSHQINQAWRYGCILEQEEELESRLNQITSWMEGVLRKP